MMTTSNRRLPLVDADQSAVHLGKRIYLSVIPLIRSYDWSSIRVKRDGSESVSRFSSCGSYLRVGDALVSSSSNGLAAGGAAWPLSTMSLAVIDLP
jgi:hypothetical protein